MVQAIIRVATLILVLVHTIEPSKILAVFPHYGKSHYFMFQPFVYELAKRGHDIHVMTMFPSENPPPGITFIDIGNDDGKILFNSFSMEPLEKLTDIYKEAPESIGNFIVGAASVERLYHMGWDACENGFKHPNFKKLLKSHATFDLVIVEFFNSDCFASLSVLYKSPLVGIFSSVMMPWHNDRFGNPDNPSYIPNHFLPHSSQMSFFQRLFNTYLTYGAKLIYKLYYNPKSDELVNKYLGSGFPPVQEIVKNTTLFLVNSHFSLFQPRPLVPSIVEIGGFHVSPPELIPNDILNVIEDSPRGVIYFSLGSTVQGSTMSSDKLAILQKVLSSFPYTILWKWESWYMPNKPDNVVIRKWFPQNAILSHPKVKLFITHAGLMGVEEAVYHGVPMLMMPLFGDQPVNAASCEEKGVGIRINYFTMTVLSLSEALQTVLQKEYAENAKKLAKIFNDRPMPTLDTSIYWTEYVLRHKGAYHLLSKAATLPWYKEYLVDVVVFHILLIYFIYAILHWLYSKIRNVLRRICNYCGRGNVEKNKNSSKTKKQS